MENTIMTSLVYSLTFMPVELGDKAQLSSANVIEDDHSVLVVDFVISDAQATIKKDKVLFDVGFGASISKAMLVPSSADSGVVTHHIHARGIRIPRVRLNTIRVLQNGSFVYVDEREQERWAARILDFLEGEVDNLVEYKVIFME